MISSSNVSHINRLHSQTVKIIPVDSQEEQATLGYEKCQRRVEPQRGEAFYPSPPSPEPVPVLNPPTSPRQHASEVDTALAVEITGKAYNIEQQSVKNGKHLNGGETPSHTLPGCSRMEQRIEAGFYPCEGQLSRPRDVLVKSVSAYADIQWEQPHQPRNPGRDGEVSPLASYAPQPDYMTGDDDLIKPKKLTNPVKASKSHQELHRELLLNHKRGVTVENKSELQRVLEQRKRDQLMKQRKQEEEARRKISPLEQELLKRHQKLEELEKEQTRQEDEKCNAPEFIKVKEKLRRTSFTSSGEKEV
ncbi:hypothetical protein DNTS_004540 [Danionella cerebrum]|uniref:Actin-associated protein FAM107A n=1 Tax=Danionella cerebrum TaxID=2873325 RepID=A0A553RKK7_9TELE|nr:hypothetical protein DNTS_004540 [Danionella translucida]